MKRTLNIITLISFIASVSSILFGIFIKNESSEKYIGFGVLGLFFVVFPIFSYIRWKDKDPKDYMLTKENLDKMRDSQKY